MILKRIIRVTLKTLLWLFISIVVILILIQTPPVQNFARKKLQSYLQHKLQTKIEIGRIYIGLPSSVVLENIYLEDRSKDTLFYGGSIRANVNLFKLLHNEVDINSISLKDFTGKINRTLADSTYNFQFIIDAFASKNNNKKVQDSSKTAMKMHVNHLSLDNIRLKYVDELEGSDYTVSLRYLDTHINKFDIDRMAFDVNSIDIEGLDARSIVGWAKASPLQPKIKDTSTRGTSNGLRIQLNELRVENSSVFLDDQSSPRLKEGMDYAHLDAKSISLKAENIFYEPDSIVAQIEHASLKEQSGFTLEQLQGKFSYTASGISADNLLVQTPSSKIQRAIHATYPSLEALKNNIEMLQVQVDLPGSYVSVKDILTFAPVLRKQAIFTNPTAVFKISGKISGNLKDLSAERLQLEGLSGTKIDLSGQIKGLPNVRHLEANAHINSFQTSRKDLLAVLPATLFKDINVPERISLNGTVVGNENNIQANINFASTSGDIRLKGTAQHFADSIAAIYDLTIETNKLQAGKILKNNDLQNITAQFHLQGRGLTISSANTVLRGTIDEAGYRNYVYHAVSINALIKNKHAQLNTGITDPNIKLVLEAEADLANKYPAVSLSMNIDSIKMKALHLTKTEYIYRGKLKANFDNTDPAALNGKLDIMSSLLVTEKDRLELDTVRLLAVHRGDSERISLRSGIANINVRGIYKVSELGSIFQQSVEPYFKGAIPNAPPSSNKYSFTVSVHAVDNPTLKVLMPSLERFEELRLTGRFVSDSGWYANVDLPSLTVGSTHVEDFTMNAGTKKDSLVVKISAGMLKLAGNTIYNLGLTASAANDHLNFATHFNDRAGKEKYSLAGMVVHRQDEYEISLAENLLLNYQKWSIAKNNSIKIGNSDIAIHDFTLKHSNEQLVLQSIGNNSNAPLKADFSNFTIGTLAAFVMPDSLAIDGTVNGSLNLRNVMQKPSFSGDLTINNLSFKKDTAGDLRVAFTSNSSDLVHAEMKLTGRGNTVDISGNYYPQATDGNEIKVDVNLSQLNLAAVEGITMGEITRATGNITGRVTLSGKTSAPTVNGSLNFKKVVFTLSMLNSQFKVDDKDIVINQEGIKFNNFTIRDSADNTATLDGMVYTTNFTSYKFAVDVKADNFRILNTPKNANKLYYGQLYFSSNMRVNGTDLLPVVDGRITILNKTKLTVVVPEQSPGVESQKGIVQFVNRKVPENDTLFMSTVINDSINRARITGLDISANIEIKKEAEFNLIVDEANGDFLRMKGEGLLTSSIDRSGKITMAGSYELTDGEYQMTFNFLKRKFNIQQGSRIVWEGDPLKATLDITAIYIAKAAPLDLVKDLLGPDAGTGRNAYLQRLPFQVYLKAQGELLHPFISFDIQLPQDKNYGVGQDVVESSNIKLTQLRQDQSELNKQVFALLLLNRFITENPFESSTGGLSAETFARQSASRLLTEQLNQLAGDLVKGVDINFDVSSTQDYSTGSEEDRTELNVSLSKRLLNDQLTVTVGSNFQLEGQNTNQNASNIAGDVAVDYKLSKDGRYMLRAYRKNEYEGIVDGYVVETGVGFIFTLDYNRFRDIFLSEKKKEERRKARKKAAENQQGS